ncbi:UxaA family hydrolase [Flagellimonas sp. 2504JD4-2]
MENFNTLIKLAEKDNVLVSCVDIKAKEIISYGDDKYLIDENISFGHKVALRDINKGDPIIKFNTVIGTATEDIKQGQHVHVHNIKSNFIPTYIPKQK